jgi:heme-degrading monooxygenase HmoA
MARRETHVMFARLTITQQNIDTIEESIGLYADSVIPAAKSQKGYRGVCLLIDREKGKGISISLWDSEEDAIANEQSGYYQEQVAKFKDMFTAPPVQEGYEVALQD